MNHYYLIVYSRSQGKILLGPVEFGPGEGDLALERRFELDREYAGNRNVEVVVLGAESEEQIRRTHGRYFKTIAELAS